MKTAYRALTMAAALALAFGSVPAHADNMTTKDASAATKTICTKTVSTVEHPCHLGEGLSGGVPTPMTLDGSGNLNVNVQSATVPTGGATAANQTAAQANAGSDASKAFAVQGVTGGKPLPAAVQYGPSGVTSVTPALTSATCSAAFTPIAGRAFNVSAWGTFVATYQLFRSFDAGTTKLPITVAGSVIYQWTGPASESAEEAEYGVSYYVCATSYTSGTLNLRISQ